jgi:phospholipid transport system substrate-binding protein
MPNRTWPVAVLVTLAAALGPPAPAPVWAGPPTDQVRQYTDQVIRVLEDPALRQGDRRQAVRRIAGEIFDVNETAQRALGVHWRARTAAEKDEFTHLFADLLERTYINRIDLYGGERLRFTGESVDGDRAVVRAFVITRRGTEVPVEARMLRRSERWLVYDVVIEGMSLIQNYRTQFDRILRTSSWGELMRRLREKRLLNEAAGSRPPS